MNAKNKLIAVAIAASIVAAACGSTTTSATDTGDEPSVVDQPNPTTDDPAGAQTQSLMPEMALGSYATTVLHTPITVSFDRDLVTRVEEAGLIGLGLPDLDPVNAVLVFNPAGAVAAPLSGETGEISIAPYPTDLGAWFAESPEVEVVDTGAAGDVEYWDLRTADGAAATDGCNLGPACVRLFNYGADGEMFVAIGGTSDLVFRIYELETADGTPLLVMAQGSVAGHPDVVAVAEDVIEDICFCGPEAEPEPSSSEVVGLDTIMFGESIPAGTYGATLGSTELTLATQTEYFDAGVFIVADGDALFFLRDGEAELGVIIFSEGRLVAPTDTAKSPDTGVPLETIQGDDIESWADTIDSLVLLETGTSSIGGQSAIWWDLEAALGVGDSDTYVCFPDGAPPGFEADARCISTTFGQSQGNSLVVGQRLRIYRFEQSELSIHVGFLPSDFDAGIASAEKLFELIALGQGANEVEVAEGPLEDEFDEIAAAVQSEPDIGAFCAEALTDAPPELLDADTPQEQKALHEGGAASEELLARLAPRVVRSDAQTILASRLRFIDTAAAVDWDLDQLPPTAFVMSEEVGAALDRFFGFVGANCN